MNIKGTHVVPFFISLEDMTNFAVYTKNGCPYCSKIKQILDAKGFTYQEYKLDVDFNRESFYDEFGRGSTFPQVLLMNNCGVASMQNSPSYNSLSYHVKGLDEKTRQPLNHNIILFASVWVCNFHLMF